ncbi:HTH-type transcriptional activator CmpR [compost metagenome]
MAENAADVGCFADLGTTPQDVITLPYREDELVVVVPRRHALASRKKLSTREVLEHYLIGLQTGSYINMQLLRYGSEHSVPVKFRMQVNSYDAVCLMVESDMGIGILPVSLARRYARTMGIRVVALDAPWAQRKLNLCIRSYEALPVAARKLVDHLCPSAQALVASAGATRAPR